MHPLCSLCTIIIFISSQENNNYTTNSMTIDFISIFFYRFFIDFLLIHKSFDILNRNKEHLTKIDS